MDPLGYNKLMKLEVPFHAGVYTLGFNTEGKQVLQNPIKTAEGLEQSKVGL